MEQNWLPDGFTAWSFLVAWLAIVLIHGIWRSLENPNPDPIRPSGPTG